MCTAVTINLGLYDTTLAVSLISINKSWQLLHEEHHFV